MVPQPPLSPSFSLLQAENSALAQANENQRETYERCLDEVCGVSGGDWCRGYEEVGRSTGGQCSRQGLVG